MDPTLANPFRSRRIVTPVPTVEQIDGGKPDHRPDTVTHNEKASALAMKMAEMARREMVGYAHSGWCAVQDCTCRTVWLAARFDELMKR
jgi:hypothetical protein